MNRAITIFCLLGILCFVGIWIAYRLYVNNQNAKRTEKARAASIESKQNRKVKNEQPEQPDLFSSDDVNQLNDSKNS